MASKILEKTNRQITKINNTFFVSIPFLWKQQLNIKEDDEVEVALMEGKQGKFLAVWNKDNGK